MLFCLDYFFCCNKTKDFVPSATIGWALEFGPEMLGTKLAHSPELTNVLTTAATQISRGTNPLTPSRARGNSNPQTGSR